MKSFKITSIMCITYFLLLPQLLNGFLNWSPFVLIDNRTKLTLSCIMTIECDAQEIDTIVAFKKKQELVRCNPITNIHNQHDTTITVKNYHSIVDHDNQQKIVCTVHCTCLPERTVMCDSIMYDGKKLPGTIKEIMITEESLQISMHCCPTDAQRHVIISYDSEIGCTTNVQPIAYYVHGLLYFKQALLYILKTGVSIADLLPY